METRQLRLALVSRILFSLLTICVLSVLLSGQLPSTFNSSNKPLTIQSTEPSSQKSITQLAAPRYQADFAPVVANGYHTAAWGKGHMVSFGVGETKEPVALFDKTGRWLFENQLQMDGAAKVYVHDATVTNSETAVLAVASSNAEGIFADLIVEMGKQGMLHAIWTTPFRVLRVCSTNEGTVWAYGEELSSNRKTSNASYPMLREYSFEKGEIRSVLHRSSVHLPTGVPVEGAKRDVYLRCASNKIILVNGPSNELVEFDSLQGKLDRLPITPLPEKSYISGVAVTDSGQVFISTLKSGENAQSTILQLHASPQEAPVWNQVATAPVTGGNFLLLMGSDNEDLVYSRGRHTPTVYWSEAPSTGGGK